jgi:hypothetical protein
LRGSTQAVRAHALWVALSGCGSFTPGTFDVVPASHDIVVDAGVVPGSPQGYDYVARRPLAVVALAEARGIDATVARMAVDRLADALETCVAAHGRPTGIPRGAARVVGRVADDGTLAGTSLRVDPGAGGGADIAVLCLLAPADTLVFPAADAGVRGIAIEALWGPKAP